MSYFLVPRGYIIGDSGLYVCRMSNTNPTHKPKRPKHISVVLALRH